MAIFRFCLFSSQSRNEKCLFREMEIIHNRTSSRVHLSQAIKILSKIGVPCQFVSIRVGPFWLRRCDQVQVEQIIWSRIELDQDESFWVCLGEVALSIVELAPFESNRFYPGRFNITASIRVKLFQIFSHSKTNSSRRFKFHPYKSAVIQKIIRRDFVSRKNERRSFIENLIREARVFFSAEVDFHKSGCLNKQNIWSGSSLWGLHE